MITTFIEALQYMEQILTGSIALLVCAISVGIMGFFWSKGTPAGTLISIVFGIFLLNGLYYLAFETIPDFVAGISILFLLFGVFSGIIEILKGGKK